MNLLPDMIVLEFCEWLNSSIKSNSKEYDIFDLLLDEQYSYELREYAEDFLIQYSPSIKNILHKYIESKYFDESLNRCKKNLGTPYAYKLCMFGDEMYIHECFHKGHFDQSISRYVQELCRGNKEKSNYRNIQPYDLANSASHLFLYARKDIIKKDKNPIIHFMNSVDINLDVEIDFLEWLLNNNSNFVDIPKMPLKTFEIVVDKFIAECNKNTTDKKKLIKSFKYSDFTALSQKLLSVLSTKTIRRGKNLRNIIERYQDATVRFKCFIVPREADTREYKELIENRWIDLHHMSGNHLDIYYTETDYGKSGYEIMNCMNFIPDNLKSKAPIIVIWENSLQEAKGIDISRLNNEDIFDIIQCVVNSIRSGQPIEAIVREANNMSKDLREKKRTISYNMVNINGGTVNGPVAGVNYGTMQTVNQNENVTSQLLSEFGIAKQIIREFSEFDESYKEQLETMIDEVKATIENNDKEGQERGKKSFKNAIFFMGNVGSKLITAFSHLTNVLKFFDISPV